MPVIIASLSGEVMLSLFRPKVNPAVVALHEAIVAGSRVESFYTRHGVPDTVDGRFGLLALHTFLVLRRLRGVADNLAQDVFDRIFTQLDLNLRELGVGDLGVGKRVRAMAESLYGSMSAYEAALKSDDDALYRALANNLFGTLPEAPPREAVQPIINYIRASVASIDAQLIVDILNGKVEFPDA